MGIVQIHNWSAKQIIGLKNKFVGVENQDSDGCTVCDAQVSKQFKKIKRSQLKQVG